MVVTEEQARKIYCCGKNNSDTCVASCCMAWRWYDDDAIDGPEPNGLCGLAGRPE